MTSCNDITGEILATKPASEAYRNNYEALKENNKLIEGKTCQDCGEFEQGWCSMWDMLVNGDNKHCSFFGEK